MHPLLLLIADARFPAGGHTQSVGVESAVHYGDVADVATLARYVRGRLATTGVVEAAFAARTATGPGDEHPSVFVDRLDTELAARLLAPRARTVSRQLGRQLMRVAGRVADDALLHALDARRGGPLQPIAFGALVRAVGGTPLDAARIQLHHVVAAGTTAAVRLLGLDPLELTALAAELADDIERKASRATECADATIESLPAWSGTLTEILAEDHGAWSARLFAA